MTTTPRTIADVDVRTAQVESQMTALVARQQLDQAFGVLRDAMAATNSPSDLIAYAFDAYLLAHPEACSTEADYPGWTPGGNR